MWNFTRLMPMTSLPSLIVLISVMVVSPANAHVTYNVGGFGDTAIGASNSTMAAKAQPELIWVAQPAEG